MNTVRLKKADLLKKILANRERHQARFEKALDGYLAKALVHLQKLEKQARAGQPIDYAWPLAEPKSHAEEYDAVIAMLRMSLDDVIELPAEDFRRFVLDDWEWRESFLRSTALYLAKKR